MPDSLDPVEAVFEGVTDLVKRLVAFVLVTACGAILGLNLHEAPLYLASFRANGFDAIFEVFQRVHAGSPILWSLMMLHSAMIVHLLPFTAVYVWLLFGVWKDENLFLILLGAVLLQTLHVFLYLQRSNPLTGGNLILASALLIVTEISLAGGILWWKHMKDNTEIEPMDAQTEPEL
jgi:hypothetical protein